MVFEPAWVGDASRRVLEEAQQRLGEVNDVCTLVERLEGWQRGPAGVPEGLVALRDRFITIRDLRATRAVEWWQANGGAVLTMAPSAGPAATEPVAAPAAAIAVEPAGTNGDHRPDPRAVQGDLWMSGLRVAVIDIGSNSIRLLAVEVIDRTSWRVLAEERAQTRLVQGMAAGGVLCPEAMARSVEAIAGFKRLAEERGVGTIRAYATAAVRDADNREAFISLVRERAGLTLEIVSARDEGSLTYRSVARVFDLEGQDAAVVDIGGGSLEVVQARHGVVIANASMPLGAVRVTERFGGAEVCCAAGYGAMSRWVRRHLRRKVRTGEGPPAVLVGCGGTFTTLLTLAAATRGFMIERNSPGLAGLGPVSRVQVRRLLRSLRGTPLAERLRVPGLPADRADIIVAGLTVVYRLMKHLGAMQVRVHPGGFREGLLLRLIEREAGTRAAHSEATDAQRLAGARAFAARSGYDRDHSEHVATLAVSLFDQLRQESDFIPGLGTAEHERVMLECAAVLHDVGMLVEYRRHHRHGETMVRHADLPGWSEREVEIIAQVVRYHRRASPRSTHRAFEALPESDRALVRRLAGILRVADGLDRCHARNCSSVHLRFGPRGVQIDVAAREGAPKDLKAARKKSDLLSRLLGQPLRIVPAEQNAV
jgi:exopolyphosphatase / guanosine-5'-triphosphate,3'-diphosphate pyrophosphatase